ncbi:MULTISPECIES: ornithine carbamoyltransferase [unclassified Campylobacter]|uniref:ornithine carbamoyltransferase n=1 Tax=unclassified Campylobacter TaxID=2593542 RepID=UPI001237D44D|nr:MULTISPECIES: ornithine carbamoyltransferase [unclassified Campylobacter]KAA6227153.1 ornithine carbamoyltransferase [Campylobacter sp. LR185c]KAA6227450.1 ornithine carbamoyltransferase [Campylobacter sp. LR196d]KAA6228477.1 ornithine carbamoyltransferase [Campylobacter sp. LR286c]KAA6233502.1 ornithine carbamoyltransferase [Campylobacter sp. LR264d]KAA8603785.1 ornithine carbamoyltransferase [Campylobacter sp. LR185c]
MRISLECKDILIARALELFLKEHLVMKKDCDFIICDEKITSPKPLFIISNNSPFLSVPFSKEILIANLQEFDTALKLNAQKLADEQRQILESKIDAITTAFKEDYQHKIDLAIADLKDKLVKALMNV